MKIILSSKMHHYVERVGIFLVLVALIVGMPGCEPAGCGSVLQYALNVFSTLGGMVAILGEGASPYPYGATVELVASPDAGYRFVQWTGDVDDIDDVTSPTITVTMNRAYSITANFIAQYDLAIDSTGGGSVIAPGEGTFTYDAGTVVDLVATPASGYFFVEWTGDVGTIAEINAAETTITMNGNYSITANFEQIPPGQFPLTISSTAGGSVNPPGDGTRTYVAGTVVELVANPDAGCRFVNWTGDVEDIDDVTSPTITITINRAYSITANFIAQCDLAIDSTDGGEVITPGEGTFTYDAGTVVDLLVEAEAGYQFVNWTGNVSTIADVNAATTTITMNDDYTITASFDLPIWDWYDLDAIRDNLGGNYVLMKDLDSTTVGYTELASKTANEGKGWQPIGSLDVYWEPVDSFTGTFDGQGYEISDLFIDRPDEYGVGLFGAVVGGVIENVGVVNGNVAGKDSVGGLAGKNEGTVGNSYSTGRVTGRWYVGGLVGHNSGTVGNSCSTGRVTGKDSVGGLVGQNEGNVSNSYCTGSANGGKKVGGLIGRNEGTVSNSYSTGRVTGKSNVGGLAGHNSGTVSNSYSTSSVTGKWYVGGLVGRNDATGTVNDSYSTGGVNGRWYVGGLVGQNEGNVSNSYSTGSATGNNNVGGLVGKNSAAVSNSYATGSANGGKNVGGLIGRNKGTVSNSYSTGSVTGTSNVDGLVGGQDFWSIVSNFYAISSANGGKNVGGLIGRNEGAVSNSFWDTKTSGQATSDGGTGKTTAQMKDITTFSSMGWDIIAVANSGTRNTGYIWNIVDVTYPFLSWQPV